MIPIDFVWAVSLFISAAITVVYLFWLVYTYSESDQIQDSSEFIRCMYCNHIFFNYKKAEMISCPLCRSLISLEEEPGGENRPKRRKKRKRIDV